MKPFPRLRFYFVVLVAFIAIIGFLEWATGNQNQLKKNDHQFFFAILLTHFPFPLPDHFFLIEEGYGGKALIAILQKSNCFKISLTPQSIPRTGEETVTLWKIRLQLKDGQDGEIDRMRMNRWGKDGAWREMRCMATF
jgi:hypothetical protein